MENYWSVVMPGKIVFEAHRVVRGRSGAQRATRPHLQSGFSDDSTLLASAGPDHAVRVWDGTAPTSSPKSRYLIIMARAADDVPPESRFLLTAADGGQLILWDWTTPCRHEWRLSSPSIAVWPLPVTEVLSPPDVAMVPSPCLTCCRIER